MRNTWIVGCALLLSACSSTPSKVYYQLPSPLASVKTVSADAVTARTLWIPHITLTDVLSSSGLVYQTSEVRYTTANNNLWASPLDQQLQQSLIASLNTRLPGWVVSAQPLGNTPAALNVTVKAFHGRYDGKAVVQGEWTFSDGGQVLRQPFSLVLPQTEDGYDALVKTLAQGWQQVAQSMAEQIARAG